MPGSRETEGGISMIKKTLALLLAAMMLLGCAALAEEAAGEEHIIQSGDGQFSVTFLLPPASEVISGEWLSPSLYLSNIRSSNGLYICLTVSDLNGAEESAAGDDTSPVTYNEANGFTDEYLLQMIDELYADDFTGYEKSVAVTAYGTKLAVMRVNDPGYPYAYLFTIWNNYEIGLSLFHVDKNGRYQPVTDDQITQVVNFTSELWIYSSLSLTDDSGDSAADLVRFVDVSMPETISGVSFNEQVLSSEGFAAPLTSSVVLSPLSDTAGLETGVSLKAGNHTLGLKLLVLSGDVPGVTEIILNPPQPPQGFADAMTAEEIKAFIASGRNTKRNVQLPSVLLNPGSGWEVVFCEESLKITPLSGSPEILELTSVPGHAGETGQVTLSNDTLTMEVYAAVLEDGTPAVYSVTLE